MKIKLWCKLFGHDFRCKREEGEYIIISISDYCRNCGLSKEEVFKVVI
jgi:hypothetical protein